MMRVCPAAELIYLSPMEVYHPAGELRRLSFPMEVFQADLIFLEYHVFLKRIFSVDLNSLAIPMVAYQISPQVFLKDQIFYDSHFSTRVFPTEDHLVSLRVYQIFPMVAVSPRV